MNRKGQFQSGHSGNPRGRPKKRTFDIRLANALTLKGGETARELISALLSKAKTGDVQALKLICERVCGKPKPFDSHRRNQPPAEEKITRDQVQARLADLLNRYPEVKETMLAALAPDGRDSLPDRVRPAILCG